ncbi:hypothetical protein QJQ45_028263 [Haematococcus lacustris]|nr:hypothetical protein QJQ45_028263 [Haematococcus lacustris]
MPPVKKQTRANRANGAKTQARHNAAKSMEQLTAAHAALTAAHAALNVELLCSQELYRQLRERHCSLSALALQRDQQWELDLLGFMQQVDQLEEAFQQQLQGTQAQLTDTAAALEAAQKDLAAARTELAHTKRQLTTTSIKLEQLRAQVAAANKGFTKDQKDKWNLLLRSRVSLPFLRGMLSNQSTKPATQPACHPATQSSSLARSRNQECDTHTGGYTAEYILSRERLLSLPGVSAEQLGTLCTPVVGAVFPGADPGRQASATTHRRNHDLLQTYIHEAHTGCQWIAILHEDCTQSLKGRITVNLERFGPGPPGPGPEPGPGLPRLPLPPPSLLLLPPFLPEPEPEAGLLAAFLAAMASFSFLTRERDPDQGQALWQREDPQQEELRQERHLESAQSEEQEDPFAGQPRCHQLPQIRALHQRGPEEAEALAGAQLLGAKSARSGSEESDGPSSCGTCAKSKLLVCAHVIAVWLRRSFAVHVQLDGCTIPAHGKVVLYRVTAAVRCFSPSPAAAAGSPSPAPAAAAGSPSPAPAPAVGSPSPAPAAAAGSPSSAPAPLPTARTPEVQEMSSPTPQLEVKARVVAVRKCPDSSSYPAVKQFVDVCRKQGVWGSLASITVDSAAGNIGRISGLAVSINALRRQQGLALIIFWPCVSHQIHNALHKAMTTWGKAEGWSRQGLQAQLALSIEQLCSLTKKHWDLLGLSVQHCAQPSEPSQSRWGSYVDACSSLTRVLKPVTAAVTGIMERQGKAAPAWAGDLCSLLLDTDLICKLMVVAVVGQQLVMPDLGWVATKGGMHAFELARHVEQLLDNLLDASTQDAEERFPYIFKHAQELFVATAPSSHTAAGSLPTAAASAPNPLALEGPQQWAAAKPKLVKAAEQVLKQRDTRLQEWDVHQWQKQQQQQGGRRQAPSGQQFLPFDPAVFDPYATLEDFLDDIRELAAGQPCSLGLRTHLVEFFGAAPSSNHAVESSLQHTKHGNSAKQGLDAMIGSINNKLDPGALANIDLADFEARLLTLRKQKRDKETTSADDNREAKAARKTEESACMVDGNAKMVLNVPTQAPLQQLRQAFQQHARGADYSNTSAKEATRFTREQLRAYLLYHKVPPRDQPVGSTLVAGWQKAVQKHIAERGSPTGHGVLP